MSIRWIARELYRLQQDVARWERELASAPADRRDAAADRLRQARAERDRMRAVLDGRKEAAR
jgi:hypothetical protein